VGGMLVGVSYLDVGITLKRCCCCCSWLLHTSARDDLTFPIYFLELAFHVTCIGNSNNTIRTRIRTNQDEGEIHS
jgi:hypothetical protein